MENENKFLSVKDLVVEYTSDGEVIHAVNGVSFDLDKGKCIGLVGETGAGKTTIAKSILQIIQTPPGKIKQGEIIFEGEDLLKKDEEYMLNIRGGKISMIFQDPMTALNPTMTIGSQIAEVVKLHANVSNLEAREQAISILNRVGIVSERYNDYPFQFSGGMKQRVVIAMALVFKPDLILANEPTTALDVTIQAQILDIIRDYKEKFGCSMVLITHDLGIVAENCDSVAVVYAGQILEYGSLEDIFDHPSHPYTLGLFRSLPNMSIGEKRLHPIAGALPDPRNLPKGCVFGPRCPYASDKCKEAPVELSEIAPGHMCRCINREVK